MEEGEILSTTIISTEAEEEEVSIATNVPPSSPTSGMKGKASEGPKTPGGFWAEMVKQSKITQKYYSPKQTPSQNSQEMQDAAQQPNTRGRKSQRYNREREAKRDT